MHIRSLPSLPRKFLTLPRPRKIKPTQDFPSSPAAPFRKNTVLAGHASLVMHGWLCNCYLSNRCNQTGAIKLVWGNSPKFTAIPNTHLSSISLTQAIYRTSKWSKYCKIIHIAIYWSYKLRVFVCLVFY